MTTPTYTTPHTPDSMGLDPETLRRIRLLSDPAFLDNHERRLIAMLKLTWELQGKKRKIVKVR